MLGRASDDQLLAQWARGHRRAGDRLMRRHVASLRRFFEVKAPEVAEDLTQATLLACVEGSDRFRGDAPFKSYLFGIARRRLLLYLRSQERQERMHGFREAQGPDTVLTPSRCAALRQEQTAMLMGLAALPVQLQMTVQLYYWEGMKAGEIGQVFSIPASTVTSRLARARALIREQIEAGLGRHRARAIAEDFDRWLRSLAD
ncbi:MAG: sigma-70 family RNA polymerase sigma factor [Myxococcota bacterium]